MKEPAITLFGTKIVLPEKSSGGGSGGKLSGESESLDLRREEGCGDEIIMKVQINQEEDQESGEAKPQEKDQNPGEAEDSQHTTANDKSEESEDNPKTPSIGEEVKDVAPTESDATNAEQNQKTQKKPDNILPCPRCKSMDTKFCYYNNYNILQPRHFCKACQRYWTAGGTMRNVPVGAGRRKNKNPATISEAHHAGANIDARNGRVLSFGQNSASAAATVLSPTGQRLPNGVRNASFSGKIGENRDDGSSGSSISTANLVENGGNLQNMNVVPPHNVPCIPGVPWPYPWNAAVPMPAICPGPGYTMPYYPAAPFWPNAIPWLSLPSPSSGSSSPLGKHSRDGELINSKAHSEEKSTSEKSSIVVPRTLRGDDPEEAAKSSIWSTLGLKYYENSREGLFKSLQPKDDEKKAMVDATSSSSSPALTANPAALSRSATFRERA